MTSYKILQEQHEPAVAGSGQPTHETFEVVATIDAANARAAVARFAKENGTLKATYIATPARSWKTVHVTTENKVQIKFT